MLTTHLQDSEFPFRDNSARMHLDTFLGTTYRLCIQTKTGKTRITRRPKWETVSWVRFDEKKVPEGEDNQSAFIYNLLDVLIDQYYLGTTGYISEEQSQQKYTLNPTSVHSNRKNGR